MRKEEFCVHILWSLELNEDHLLARLPCYVNKHEATKPPGHGGSIRERLDKSAGIRSLTNLFIQSGSCLRQQIIHNLQATLGIGEKVAKPLC